MASLFSILALISSNCLFSSGISARVARSFSTVSANSASKARSSCDALPKRD
jgi:hypothetical protein